MEVQIKGFPMPDSCVDCKMAYDGSYCILVEDDNDAIEGGKMWRRCPLLKRPNWCPLEEVRHGEWLRDDDLVDGEVWSKWSCSECGYVRTQGYEYTTNGKKPQAKLCENCGTRMDGGKE